MNNHAETLPVSTLLRIMLAVSGVEQQVYDLRASSHRLRERVERLERLRAVVADDESDTSHP